MTIESLSSQATLIDLLRRRALAQPERLAFTFLLDGETEEIRVTYSELDRQARAIAASLKPLLAPGDRALLLYPPGLDYIAAFFGCLYAGAVAVTAYPPRRNRSLDRLEGIVADAQARVALTTESVFSRTATSLSQSPCLESLSWLTTDNIVSGLEDDWLQPAVTPDALAFLQYTSGSTSTPKGVMLSHRNLLHNEQIIQQAFAQTEQSLIVGWLPLYHDMGLIGNVLQPLFVGAPCVLMSPLVFLQRPFRWLQAISRYKATTSGGPNFAYDLCVRKVTDEQKASLDLSSWSVAFNGAEPIRHETMEQFVAAFQSCGFRREAFQPCYGLAESTLIVSGGLKGRGPRVRKISASELGKNRICGTAESKVDQRLIVGCGGALLDQKIVVVDTGSLTLCSAAEVGEIWVSGPSVAQGYWNKPEETALTFGARLSDTGEGDFLRTGDLGFLHDGELFVTGRLKDLIIIRGLNHYPQDIELTVERCHPALRPGGGAAFSVETGSEERLIIVQEVKQLPRTEMNTVMELITQAVSDEHEVQVEAITLIKPGSILKTSSGKIQRAACRAAFLERHLDVTAEWYRTDGRDNANQDPVTDISLSSEKGIESWIQSELAANLKVEARQIDTDQPISRYGLDSLTAIELLHSIELGLGAVLPLTTILDGSSVNELAATVWRQLTTGVASQAAPVASSRSVAEHQLSHGQQSLWFLHQVAPESAAYNIITALRIVADLDAMALCRVFQLLVNRHPALRTTFPAVDGRPVQLIHEDVEVCFHEEDSSSSSEAPLNERLLELAQLPFDLERGPLLRLYLFKRSEQEHVLLITAHHIIADFWSLAVLMEELGTLYDAEQNGSVASAAPALRYTDYVLWQQEMLKSEEGERHWTYWRQQLSGELPVLELSTDRPRPPAQTYRGASEAFKISAETTQKLKALSSVYGATLYMTLLAAFQLFLSRYTGQDEILVGSPTAAGRNWAQLRRVVGYFVNPVVLRTQLNDNESFGTLLRRVRQTVLEAFDHQSYPFDLLVERLQPERDSSRSPLFQVMFTLQKARLLNEKDLSSFALGEMGPQMKLGGLQLESIALDQRAAQFDIALAMAEVDEGLSASLQYNTDLFNAATIIRMKSHFENLLDGIVANPEERVARIPMLSASEQQQLLGEWSQTCSEEIRHECIHQLFESQVARTPDAIAVSCGSQCLSYAELNARANQLARYLQGCGVGPEVAVGLCVERSVEMVIGLLGVLKAGAVYVPLDPQYPAERLQFILKDVGAAVLLKQSQLSGALAPQSRARVVCLDSDRPEIAKQSAENTSSAVLPGNLAYVIHTSGSTGKPKGVAVSHEAAVSHLIAIQKTFNLDAADRVLQFASLSFDVSLEQILAPLLIGARVVLRDDSLWTGADFARNLNEEALTVVNFPTAYWHQLMQECAAGSDLELPHYLKLAIIGGDTILPEAVRLWQSTPLKAVRLLNAYGPTEAVITSSTFEIPAAFCDELSVRRVPIGRPVIQRSIYILDHSGNPAPIGVAGEIHIGGPLLARGYLNWPELTAERFVPDPFTDRPGARLYRTGDLARYLPGGDIEFLGRFDNQVKVRGFRVELGEIEAALSRNPAVRDSVMLVQGDSGHKQIVACVVAQEGQQLTAVELRKYLKDYLPDYMIPAAFAMLDELPLTPSGKVDKRAVAGLAQVDQQGESAFQAPRGTVEEVLAAIWSDVLGVAQIGVHDNFFALGGDSILTIQVVARAIRNGLGITPKDIFQHQTIAELATVVGTSEPCSADQSPVTGLVPLTPIQHWFFEQNLAGPHHYNQSVLLEVERGAESPLLEKAAQHLLLHHDALRLRFVEGPTGWEQHNSGPEDCCFSRVDLSGQTKAQQIAGMEAAAERLQQDLNLIDGPLVKIAYFDLGPEERGRLLLVIHHLAVDGVSWRILLEDLENAYMQMKHDAIVELPAKTTSFKQWAIQQNAEAQTTRWEQELSYWQAASGVQVTSLPRDHASGENTETSASTVSLSLSTSETLALLRDVPSIYRTQINDVLLTALVRAFVSWTGERFQLIDLEGHGREELAQGLDISRTVGWFTAVYPVRLELKRGLLEGEALKSIKEQLRQIPNKGLGYGMLRFLCSDALIRQPMRHLPQAEVSFNYLGQFDQLFGKSSLFRPAKESSGTSREKRGKRSYLLNIEARIVAGQLQIEWIYSESVHKRSTIVRVADDFLATLRSLIEHCKAAEEGSFTPSDFPLANLNEQQLSKVSALMGAVDK